MKRITLTLSTLAATIAAIFLVLASNTSQSQTSRTAPEQSSLAGRSNAGSAAWLTDFSAARQKANTEQKPILLDFTGSDWCGWCMKLDSEIFSTPEFRDYAKKHLVLMKVDFPANKPQSDAEKIQNQQLASRFQIEGYPTLVILASDGRQLGTLGYMSGGPKQLLEKLAQLTSN